VTGAAFSADCDVIAAALESRQDEIVAAGVAAIRKRMPVYAALDEAGVDDVRRHVARHHAGIVAAFRRPLAHDDLDFVAVHVARRARGGISLPQFLEAFRVYHGVVWRSLTELVDEQELSGRATSRRCGR
jgi:hypothetical protein